MKPEYKRILLKLSGEGLSGGSGFGINHSVVTALAESIAEAHYLGVQICVVIGGGNFFRGVKNSAAYMDRSIADQVGMLATVMNALTIRSALESISCPAAIFSGLDVPQVCERYNFRGAVSALEQNKVVIFSAGTGSPYFTTDTGAVLRALEMHCDAVFKATQVDGVYSADPRFNPEAVRFDNISYADIMAKHLKIMDMTAIALAEENNLPIVIFSQAEKNGIIKAICGQAKSTTIKK